MRATLDHADPIFVTGTPEQQQQARAEWRRQRFTAEVMKSKLQELPRSVLDFGRYMITNTKTGHLYQPVSGDSVDLSYSPAAVAYYISAAGDPVLLERPTGPQTTTELEAQQVARQQRRDERMKPRSRRA